MMNTLQSDGSPHSLVGLTDMDSGFKTLDQNSTGEMKFLRSVKGFTILDKVRNEDTCKKLKIFCVKNKIQEYRQDYLDHIRRMSVSRQPRIALYCISRGERAARRPKKGRLDHEAGTSLWPNPWSR